MKFLYLKNFKSFYQYTILSVFMIGFSQTNLVAQCSLACNGSTQVSLDSDCYAVITAGMILQDSTSCPSGVFEIEVRDEHNNLVPNSPTVTLSEIDQVLSVKVRDSVSGNSCWGNITVEDKLGPVAVCPASITLNCGVLIAFGGPEFLDNCDNVVEPILLSETIETLCDPVLIRQITRTYTAVDRRGNTSPSDCTIVLNLERIDTSQILYPDNFTIADNTQLDCSGNPWDLNGNNYPDPEEVGIPQYIISFDGVTDTIDIFPFPDVFCNTLVTFTDTELPTIGCTRKILRRYELTEWHCTEEVTDVHLQTIEITDTEGPTLLCGENITVSTNSVTGIHQTNLGNVTCGTTTNLGLPQFSDNCSANENITFDLIYSGGTEFDYDLSSQITLPLGLTLVQFTASDECFNTSSCIIHVNVVDNTPPVTVCDQNTVVSLTTGGEAVVPASSFDDGSYDDCGEHCMVVRRMTPGNCPCRIPEFCDLKFIGDRNGSYYYLSDDPFTANIAKNRAAAYGASLVIFETQEEEEYVINQVRRTFDNRFWTGVKRFGNTFATDVDHLPLSYTNWGPGQPSNGIDEDCVMVTPNNYWNDASCLTEIRYVLEVKDICGFSTISNYCCEDSGTDQMVVFRVVDLFGNFNDCMVNVNVQDKLAPQVVCPVDMTVDCDLPFDFNDLDRAFGTATVVDDCGAEVIDSPDSQVNQCNVGRLIREFTAVDNGGRTGTCKQIITFENDNVFNGNDIVCPRDTIIFDCGVPDNLLPDIFGLPTFPDDACSLIGVDHDDEIFTFNNQSTNACLKILRTFNIIDWCNSNPVNGQFPVYSCQQVIQVVNSGKPVISGCKPLSVCTFDSECVDGFIELTVNATDDCTDGNNLSWRYQVFAGQLGLGPVDFSSPILDRSGEGDTADASGKYPIGSHVVRWTFSDRCGNVTTCDQPFTIQNCKAPTAYCINGLAVDLMAVDSDNDGNVDFGMVELWASDFNAGSFHPCGLEVFLSFSPDTSDRFMTFDCTDIGMNEIDIYATVVGVDGMLLQSFCTSFLDVQDNMTSCIGMRDVVDLEGEVYTEEFERVSNINVDLEGSNLSDATDASGEYAFPNMPSGGQYTVSPSSNLSPLNGVSTFDLISIQRHILGDVFLDSPYKIIAADINRDDKLTAIDLIELRKLILGVYEDFPNNSSWRFVDQSYTFADPINPLSEEFSENYTINNLTEDMNIDFIAVKVGDVNNSITLNANLQAIDSRKSSAVEILYPASTFEANTTIEIPFEIQRTDVSGLQVAINYDNELLSNVTLSNKDNTLTDANYRIKENQIILSWNTLEDVITSNSLFTISATTLSEGSLDNAFTVNAKGIAAEVYTHDGIKLPVIKARNAQSQELVFELLPNQPNPFALTTDVTFTIPQSSGVQITIVDVDGIRVHSDNAYYSAGTHTVTYNASDLGTSGIYYLTIQTNKDNATMKMVMLK